MEVPPPRALDQTRFSPKSAPAMEPATTVSKRFFKPGFFMRRRQILLPTWRLSALAAIVIGLPAAFAFLNAYDWLVVNEPVPGAPSVIVEGWMPDYALEDAAA